MVGKDVNLNIKTSTFTALVGTWCKLRVLIIIDRYIAYKKNMIINDNMDYAN